MIILTGIILTKLIGMKKIKYFAEYWGGFTLMCASVVALIVTVVFMCITHGYHNPIAS
jgi:hypothetical protein